MKLRFTREINDNITLTFSLCERWNLVSLLEFMLSKEPYLPSSFLENSTMKESFMKISGKLRYELIKNTYFHEIAKGNQAQEKSSQDLETVVIFNFLDVLVHESLDNSTEISRKRKYPWQIGDNPQSKKPVGVLDGLFLEHSDTDITLVVDGYKLYVNSLMLTGSSPVFKAMLDSNFKEGREKLINLPGKNISEVMNFLTHLNQPTIAIGRL